MLFETVLHWAERTCDRLCDLKSYPSPSEAAPKIIAHRGAWNSSCTENTMDAFERARQLGAWAVELDVHFTRDNVAVVNHDENLQRCHRHSGVIAETDAALLPSTVPRLEQVLALTGLHFMLEIKKPLTPGQAHALSQLLAGRAPVRDYHLLALTSDRLHFAPALPREAWILVGDINMHSLTREAMALGLGGVAGHYLFMTDSLIKKLHAEGLRAGVGFSSTRNLYQREWRRGVDWVFTNHLDAITKCESRP